MSFRRGIVGSTGACRNAFRPALARSGRHQFHSSTTRQEHFLRATPEEFKKRVMASGEGAAKPILVDFYASWCGPCKILSPLLEEVTSEPDRQIDLMTIDCDEHMELAQQYNVRVLPTVIAFVNGQQKDSFKGAIPKHELEQFCDKLD